MHFHNNYNTFFIQYDRLLKLYIDVSLYTACSKLHITAIFLNNLKTIEIH